MKTLEGGRVKTQFSFPRCQFLFYLRRGYTVPFKRTSDALHCHSQRWVAMGRNRYADHLLVFSGAIKNPHHCEW